MSTQGASQVIRDYLGAEAYDNISQRCGTTGISMLEKFLLKLLKLHDYTLTVSPDSIAEWFIWSWEHENHEQRIVQELMDPYGTALGIPPLPGFVWCMNNAPGLIENKDDSIYHYDDFDWVVLGIMYNQWTTAVSTMLLDSLNIDDYKLFCNQTIMTPRKQSLLIDTARRTFASSLGYMNTVQSVYDCLLGSDESPSTWAWSSGASFDYWEMNTRGYEDDYSPMQELLDAILKRYMIACSQVETQQERNALGYMIIGSVIKASSMNNAERMDALASERYWDINRARMIATLPPSVIRINSELGDYLIDPSPDDKRYTR